MECVALDVESFHFGIGDLDSLFVGCSVERALDFQAGFGGGRGNQLDDGQAIGQGPRTPVLRDVAEHAMFDLVPLRGARWIVMDVEHEARGVCELLQLDFP
jgi:hypothetical protein